MSELGSWCKRQANLGLWLAALAVAMAYCLKLHYSRASAADLYFILEPTRLLVQFATRSGFGFEPEGYVSTDLGIVITPACAGVNFMIMALLTLALGQLGRDLSGRDRVAWFVLALPTAFLATILVNAARIVAVAQLGAQHRVPGVFIYVMALTLLHLGARAFLGSREGAVTQCAP